MNPTPPRTPLETLNQIFGYHGFRGQQAEIIDHLINGGDALVLMPTGGGKSLCYQIPALLRPGVGIVVSPLIALMQDQVDALLQLGIRAAFLNSSLNPQQAREVAEKMRAGDLDLLYVAPERLMTPRFLEFLANTQVALFAIDEAHCVSQWGHDFRPEYIQLSVLHESFPHVPRVALTATADVPTRNEIIERLQLQDAGLFVSGFDRPNIRYQVVERNNGKRQLLDFIQREHAGDAGIIYCMSRRKVEEVAEWLRSAGWNALPYHAGLPAETRKLHQQRFLREEGLVMVATIAFGMGIDKPNVRFVAHLDLPKSLEAYYQETGRAGRDGLPANAWLSYGLDDVVKLQQMLGQSGADEARKRLEQHKLEALLGFCELTTCRRQRLLAYFGDVLEHACGNCDTCLSPPQTWDATEAAQQALSAVYRTGQRFGVGYLIDVLQGKATERAVQNNHHQLGVFGLGKTLKSEQWRGIFRQLVAHGLAEVDVEGYGGLRLSERARPLLRGEQRLQLRRELQPAAKGRAARRGETRAVAPGQEGGLLQALKLKRREVAEAQNVPPFVIFHDATLVEMAAKQPLSLEAMADITGVGARKLESYGQQFVQVVEAYLAITAGISPTVNTSLQALRAGQDVDAIAAARDLKPATIYGHLAKAIETGLLTLAEIPGISEEDRRVVEQAFAALDPAQRDSPSLKPLYDALGGDYNYGVLQCVVAGALQSPIDAAAD